MDRRPLSAGVNAIPNADPELVRDFITQEGRQPGRKTEGADLPLSPARSAESDGVSSRVLRPVPAEPPRRRRTKPSGITPVGLIPVTVRLRPEIASALKRASLERQLNGLATYTQQDIVEEALVPWLQAEGLID